MTTLALDTSCMFCGRPARRRLSPCDLPSHDFDCVRCGRYRVGEAAESRMRGTGVSRYAEMLPKIMGANRDGFRLVLPSCYKVPLGEERAIAIATYADRPMEQTGRERPASRGLAGLVARAMEGVTHRSS
jgi:hypothetical protein